MLRSEVIRNRYQVLRRLGSGASGTVYEVADSLQSGAKLALKALWTGPSDRPLLAMLRAEFGVLAAVRHPLLCRVYDFGRLPDDAHAELGGTPDGSAGRGYFLTRALIEGVDLGRAVTGDRDLGDICQLLADAARGLEVLHRAGMRHGDFKPANAIVDPERRVRLIDFGLSIAETARRAAGTLAYMAPEVSARSRVDRRADLYALGIALYQLATGALPSGDRRGAALLTWHRDGARPRLSDRRPDAPAELDRILSRLWAPDPRERLPLAAEAAAALDGCAESLGDGGSRRARTAPPAGPRDADTDVRRSDTRDDERVDELVIAPLSRPHVAALEDHYAARVGGAGGSALVEVIGDEGMGKSATLTELAWRVELSGGEVVRGDSRAATGALGAFGVALAQIAALTGAPDPIADPDVGDTRLAGFAAIGRWLAEAARRWPLAIILDDLDYADDASCALARYLAFALPSESAILIVASRRPTPAEARHMVEPGGDATEAAGEVPRVVLAPLAVDDVAILVERAAGRPDRALAQRVLRHTGGNLLHVVHTLASLARRGFPPAESVERLALPPGLEARERAVLAAADPDERRLGEALAVFGRAAELSALAAMLDQVGGRSSGGAGADRNDGGEAGEASDVSADRDGLAAVAERARARGLLAVDAAGRWGFARPATGRLVEQAIAPARRRALHAAAARALRDAQVAAGDPARVRHDALGGDWAAAAPWCPAVVQRLARAGDHAAALALGGAVLDAVDAAGVGPAAALRLELAEVCRLVGDVDRAAVALGPLIDGSDGSDGSDDDDGDGVPDRAPVASDAGDATSAREPVGPIDVRAPITGAQRARARLVLGRACEEAGYTERAEALFGDVIAGAAEHRAAAAAAARELSRLYIRRGRNADALAVAEDALARALGAGDPRVENHLLAARAFARGTLGHDDGTVDALERVAQRAGDDGDHALVATALNYAGLLAFRRGAYPQARALYERALAPAERSGDIVRVGSLRHNLAALAFHVGDYAGCYRYHAANVALLSGAGADSTAMVARKNLGHVLAEIGAYEQARVELRTAAAEAERLAMDYHAAGIDALLGIVGCRAGAFADGLRRLRAARGRFADMGNTRSEVDTLLDIAEVCMDQSPPFAGGAGPAIDEADSRSVSHEDPPRRARLLALSADLAAHRGDADAAQEALAALGPLADALGEQGNAHAEWNLHRVAARVWTALGDAAAAERSRRRALAILESIASALSAAHRVAFWNEPRRRLATRRSARVSGSRTRGRVWSPPRGWELPGPTSPAADGPTLAVNPTSLARAETALDTPDTAPRAGAIGASPGATARSELALRSELAVGSVPTWLAASSLSSSGASSSLSSSGASSGSYPSATASERDVAAAIAIERLYRLLDIYRRISGERDLDRLLELAMDTAIELSGAERGFLLLAEGDGHTLRTAVARNLPTEALRELVRADAVADADTDASATDANTANTDASAVANPAADSLGDATGGDSAPRPPLPYSRTIAEAVFRTGEAILSDAPRRDPRWGEAASVVALHLESVMCLPVRARGRIIGVLYLESRRSRAQLGDGDVRLLMAFGDQVAILLDNARLLADNAARAAQLERARRELDAALAERTQLLERRTEELQLTRRDLAAVRRRFLGDRGAFGIIGRSAAMERVFELIERLADADVPVLILGESGTGKELVARAMHAYGRRQGAPQLAINCGALPQTLLESELFGHERGAFTGADKQRLGLFEAADGGTLFLDEIAETPPRMQATLLRVLAEGVIRRVGGVRDIAVDVRVIAATHRDLEARVASGDFRADLFYRLHVVPIAVPPLRERAEDVPLLAEHFLAVAAERTGLARKRIARRALGRLMEHPWPGNVRQLEHAITNAVVLADGDELNVDDFAALWASGAARETDAAAAGPRRDAPLDPDSRRQRERDRIVAALEACGWNKSKAARMLEIPRRTFYRRLDEYGIR